MKKRIEIQSESALRTALDGARQGDVLILQRDIRLTADLTITVPVELNLSGGRYSIETGSYAFAYQPRRRRWKGRPLDICG